MHKLPNGVRITSLADLDDAIADGNTEYAILLGGGLFSRKTIARKGENYRVENHVDGSVEVFTGTQLLDEDYTLIGEAMAKGAFVAFDR